MRFTRPGPSVLRRHAGLKKGPSDRFYNFFSRSAWTVHDLAYHVAVAAVVRLNPQGRWLVSEHLAAYRFRGLIPHPGIVTWVTEAENYVRPQEEHRSIVTP